MLDYRFYKKLNSISLKELAKKFSLQIVSKEHGNENLLITGISTLKNAKAGDICSFHNIKYKNELISTKASAVIISKDYVDYCPANSVALISENPLIDFANTIDAMYPKEEFVPKISKFAAISENAKISKNVVIGDFTSIGDNVVIGDNVIIGSNTSIKNGVEIGNDCTIGDNVTISHAIIGSHVIINSGARIGESGFGILPTKTGLRYVKQLGRVIIKDFVRIGANTTIDRGSLNDTEIGTGTIIDNLVQIGHNVKIGYYSVIVSQVGISGSTEIGNCTTLAGQVGVAGHLHIGDNVTVAAKGGVTNNIPSNSTYGGFPAINVKTWRKQVATLNIITKNRNKI